MRLRSLLGMLFLSENISKAKLYQYLFYRMVGILALAAIAGILLAAFFICLLYIAWALLLYEFDVWTATAVIGCIVLSLTVGIIAIIAAQVNKLRNFTAILVSIDAPIKARINEVTNAFVSGLMGEPSQKTFS